MTASPVEVLPPETAELKQESLALVTAAKAVRIADHDGYSIAGRELVRVASLRKSIVFAFKDAKAAAFDAHRKITKLESDLLTYPMEAERILKAEMGRFDREEESRRREAEARERERLRRVEEERVLAEAQAHEDAGDHEAAEEVVSQEVVAPVVEFARPEAEGVQIRKTWAFEIVDATAINRAFLIPDEKKIRALVKALGPDAAKQVGGIAVRDERIVAVSANG
jgi:hypothetical protein